MTITDAFEKAGIKAKVRRTGKRFPRRKGNGMVTVEIKTTGQFVPGTGFAIQFTMTGKEKK